jgi:lysozyme family protein
MAEFEPAYLKTTATEGGYANDPHDRGGETYKGVSRINWPKWGGWKYIDGAKGGLLNQPAFGSHEYYNWTKVLNNQLANVNALQVLVAAFYQLNFWKRLGEISDQALASFIYDKDVNTGSMGSRWLQEAVVVTVDGQIGPKTIAAVNSSNAFVLLERIKTLAVDYYLTLAQKPGQSGFWKSWIGRVDLSPAKLAQANSRALELGILA